MKKTYLVETTHKAYCPFGFMSSVVEAEGPCQAASIYVRDYHVSLGHLNESNTVWVRDPDTNEQWCFRYTFTVRPEVKMKWVRDA